MKIDQLLTPYNKTVANRSKPKYLVVHYVGATGGAQANCKYYASQKVGASAHYFVGHAGEIWQSVLDKDIAWHCGGKSYRHPEARNSNSIGIEMCCRKDPWRFEQVTIDMAVELVKYLMAKYSIPIDRVIRHYDVTGKTCPAPFVSDGNAWNVFKARLNGGSVSNVDPSPSQPQSNLLKNGSGGQAVIDLQNKLNSLGYSCGNADGIFGAKTTEAVKAFQRDKGLSVDGIIGDNTRNALNNAQGNAPKPTGGKEIIKEYQRELNEQFKSGLDVDGIWGAKTEEASPNVKKGAKGNLTRLLQKVLSNRGYGTSIDGIFGKDTEATVKTFQQKNGLTVDGIVGKKTWKALLS